MTSTVEILRGARAVYARSPSHAPASHFPALGTFCVAMALVHVSDDGSAYDCLMDVMGDSLVVFNANHDTETVLAAWDRAIEAAEKAA